MSLAHAGVLFLDELGEFSQRVIEMLRQPLEEGYIRINRASICATMPACFQLVAAMNPCPCGEGSLQERCRCSDHARDRYARRLSGPLLDRFDLAIPLERAGTDDLLGNAPGESSARVRARVSLVRKLAAMRGVPSNSQLSGEVLEAVAPLAPEAAALLERRLRSVVLSARGLLRVRRVALTIADLAHVCALGTGPVDPSRAGSIPSRPLSDAPIDALAEVVRSTVNELHVAEALQMRVSRDFLVPGAKR